MREIFKGLLGFARVCDRLKKVCESLRGSAKVCKCLRGSEKNFQGSMKVCECLRGSDRDFQGSVRVYVSPTAPHKAVQVRQTPTEEDLVNYMSLTVMGKVRQV